MRAVLDTNVVVQAAFRRDDSDTLLRQARRGAFEIVASPSLVQELDRVLRRSHIQQRLGWTVQEIEEFIEAFREESTIVIPRRRVSIVRDESDNRFIEAAIAGRADYIVSADNDLLVLGQYENVQIVTTARFLAILTIAGG